jgi:NAD(P)H-nitrite reductase large subunit
VQCPQRFAKIGIVDRQWGHSLVVGSSGGASSSRCSLLMARIKRNTANATMTKLIMVFMKTP